MLHNQNHLSSPSNRCNKNGQCIYGFPHTQQQTTTIDDFGHIHWHRRHPQDAWVISYCPTLLLFADCHFHFDVVFTSSVFSYLYKYFFKGPDVAFFTVTNESAVPPSPQPINEIADYQKVRYLSAPESAWRILGFQTTRKEPAVDCLPVHLPGENTPQFQQANEERSCTSLLDHYFLRSSDLKELTYEEYYENYVLYRYTNGELLQPHEFVEHAQIGMQSNYMFFISANTS